MLLDVVNPYREMIEYELLWATIKDSNIKKLKESREILKFDNTLIKNKIEYFFSKINDKNFSILTKYSYQFPNILQNTPIETLYYRGDIGLLEAPKKISIVGARKATENGLIRATRLAKELTNEGYVIVSGLAQGIDTAAMKSTLKNEGHLIGVIGTPINQYYPASNKVLQDKISTKHLLVSHIPFYKYSYRSFDTKKFYFPQRNMVMAAISDATVIIEASDTSGSLTQARECLEMGRKLFILDSCFNNKIKWPHTYENRGAIRVKTIRDILDNL